MSIAFLVKLINTIPTIITIDCQVQMRACNQYSGLDYPETPHLFLEFHGSEADVRIDRSLTIN